jgi:hypothetical protein
VKVSHKARRGRKRHPVPHRPHRGPLAYTRNARRLKQRMALLFAPTIAGISELEARHELRPHTGLVDASPQDAPARVAIAGRLTRKDCS